MSLRHLQRTGFRSKPWKNGLGTTHDIAILPEGAGHDGFDLRFALSPIVSDGLFSAFEGAERVLTLINGTDLTLEFEDATHHLTRYQSLRFDTGLTPMGRPAPGGVEVVNVMVNNATWQIISCAITDAGQLDLQDGDIGFVFASHGGLSLRLGDEAAQLARFDAALATGPGRLQIDGGSDALVALLRVRPS